MTLRHSTLPLLPGFSINPNIGKQYFGRKQYLTVDDQKNCRMNIDPKIFFRPQAMYSSCFSPETPAWLLFDKKVLTFDAVFQDIGNPYAASITRLVKVMFYLEDNTIKVVEPKTVNSGLYQGTIVARQRIPLPNNENNYYEVIDLNVGKEIEIYKKNFLLVDCDNFTRSFLTKLGLIVPDPLPTPKQEDHSYKSYISQPPVFEKEKKKLSVQFLKYDKKILRFIGHWDDRQTENGKFHDLEVLYYLADDTMEIRELNQTPSGHIKCSAYVRRGPLPKKVPECLIATHNSPVDTYSPSDLMVGKSINVYGRMITLTDCDPFMKQYYRAKYGIDNFDTVPRPITSPELPMKYSQQLPPWNGYGSHKDSATNCNTIDPKPAGCDFKKFLEKDRIGRESHILRFTACLETDICEYMMRRFVISYYLQDDTISVFEVACRNSGFKGGMFFKRNSVIVPGQDLYVSHSPFCYDIKDVWIGNTLVINDYRFRLISADEYTLKYMELNYGEFDKSNVLLIINKIKQKLSSKENAYKDFVANNMSFLQCVDKKPMPIQCFETALKEIAGDILSEHEFITLSRYFEHVIPESMINRENVRSLVNVYLERNLWQDNKHLLEHLKYLDEYNVGVLNRHHVRQALIANRLPVPNEVLEQMLDVIMVNEEGEMFISDVMDFLDFKMKPAQMLIPTPAKSTKQIQNFAPEKTVPDCNLKDMNINFEKFVNSLGLENLITETPLCAC